MGTWIESGREAPDFTLSRDDGTEVKLSALRGNPVVLYFYPRDDTPGCTKEACAFRDKRTQLSSLGARVLGISTDDVESHRRFHGKFELNFPLLADTDHKVAEKYGAYRENVRFGKRWRSVQRSTFLIDAEGTVRKTWKSVKVDGHDDQVLAALKEL